MRLFKPGVALMLVMLAGAVQAAKPLPPASAAALPRWRGFNLPHMYSPGWPDAKRGFKEEEFQWMSEWGFNFVRLPLDYHFFIKDNDWRKIDVQAMAKVEQVVEWGAKYGIHVCVNLHRAPGYCINPPKEPKSVWTDDDALEVCALHWAAWAKLLKKYPNDLVSFNLFNEPSGIDGAAYARVASHLIKAIEKESPGRLIILDGIDTGTKASPELLKIKAAQALRGYSPHDISHYRAEWSGSWEGVAPPTWPPSGFNGYLYGAGKPELQKPMTLKGGFEKGGTLGLHVDIVSQDALLVVKADGKTVLSQAFKPGPGKGEWKESKYNDEWKVYQNKYDKVYEAAIPAGTKVVTVLLEKEDWLTLQALKVTVGGRVTEVSASGRQWGADPGTVSLGQDGRVISSIDARAEAVNRLLVPAFAPWIALKKSGVGVIVGEMGAYNKTPHAVALAWMEDLFKMYQAAGIGWALWNLSGSFGVLDSERADVTYENWHGRKLDRRLLELLQRY